MTRYFVDYGATPVVKLYVLTDGEELPEKATKHTVEITSDEAEQLVNSDWNIANA